MANKQCGQGQEWCPKTNKCVPKSSDKHQGRGLGKGQGKGPIGQPGGVNMDKVDEATDLVDTILTGNYSAYKVVNEVDTILDEVENRIETIPDQDVDELLTTVMDELSKDSSDIEEEENKEIEVMKPSIEESMKNSVQLLIKEEEYREFFKGMLKKYNVNSPSDLDDEKKKEFFNAIDKGWKGKKESD